jgi:hypothetical protein
MICELLSKYKFQYEMPLTELGSECSPSVNKVKSWPVIDITKQLLCHRINLCTSLLASSSSADFLYLLWMFLQSFLQIFSVYAFITS